MARIEGKRYVVWKYRERSDRMRTNTRVFLDMSGPKPSWVGMVIDGTWFKTKSEAETHCPAGAQVAELVPSGDPWG